MSGWWHRSSFSGTPTSRWSAEAAARGRGESCDGPAAQSSAEVPHQALRFESGRGFEEGARQALDELGAEVAGFLRSSSAQRTSIGSGLLESPWIGLFGALGAGTDIAPLLAGLTDDACDAPHWGDVIAGELVVDDTDGSGETCPGSDVFCWPPGHTVRVVEDAEVILFSPQAEHIHVLDHMAAEMGVRPS